MTHLRSSFFCQAWSRLRCLGQERITLARYVSLILCTLLIGLSSAVELRPHQEHSAARFVAEGNEAFVQGQMDRALTAYRRALEIDRRNFDALFNLALAHYQQEDWEIARRRFEEALLLRPEHPSTLCNLGIIAFSLGDYREAAARFAAAAEAASANPTEAAEYLFNLGRAREALGQWIEARDAYRSAHELDPQHFGALYNLGTLYMQPDMYQASAAERHLRLAHRVAPQRPEALLNLAILSERQRRFEEAESLYGQAVDVARERQSALLLNALWRRAQFYRRQQQTIAMRNDLEELLRRDENFPGANGLLGRHYHARGDHDKAIVLLEREVNEENFDPNDEGDIDTIYLLARIYHEIRPDPRRALEFATRFFRLRPDSPRERDLRQRVRSMNLGPQQIEEGAP